MGRDQKALLGHRTMVNRKSSAAKGAQRKRTDSPTSGGKGRSQASPNDKGMASSSAGSGDPSASATSVHPSWQPWLKSVLAGAEAEIEEAKSVHAEAAVAISAEVGSVAEDEVQTHLSEWMERISTVDSRLKDARMLAEETEQGLSLVKELAQLQLVQRKAGVELSRAQRRHEEATQKAQEAAERLAGILSHVRDHASPQILSKGKQLAGRSRRSPGGGGRSLRALQFQPPPPTLCGGLGQCLHHVVGPALRCASSIFGESEAVSREDLLTRHDVLTLDHSKRWTNSFKDSDPRRQIMNFFKGGDERGPLGHLRACDLLPVRGERSSFFAVWRPTSFDALRMMMQGRATGKGLNVKGKSARKGELSGFVPFLQISKDAHKTVVGTSPKEARIRVYFSSGEARQAALDRLVAVREEMLSVSEAAEAKLPRLGDLEDDEREETLNNLRWCMIDRGRIGLISQYVPESYGLDMPERLLWEAYVVRQSIVPEASWATGRPSEPAFQELNLHATREPGEPGVRPKTVLYQHDHERPLNPNGLLIAYEEETVKPVVSDIDAFLIGSRGVTFEPMVPEQVKMIDWCTTQIETILSTSSKDPWTRRWLEVLKNASDKGFKPDIPPYGFGDPTTYAIFQSVVHKLFVSGAVRHGAECSNYYFPQELDPELLVVWEGFGTVPWRYLGLRELRQFLLDRIHEGFAFPLNPKWILCDEGWLEIFEALLASRYAGTQQAMDAWFPPESGLRERIRAIAASHPDGFVLPEGAEDIDQDMAEYELRRHEMLRRAKIKLRAINRLRSLARAIKTDPAAPGGMTEQEAVERPREALMQAYHQEPSMPAPADLPANQPGSTPANSGGVLSRAFSRKPTPPRSKAR